MVISQTPSTHAHTRSYSDNRKNRVPDLGYGPDVPHPHVVQFAHPCVAQAEKCGPNDIAVGRVDCVKFSGIGSGDDELLEAELIAVQRVLGERDGR